jgi:membrane associated rhomboid family serine protease
VGLVAFVMNTLAMMFGRQGLIEPLPMVAGATGVVATLLLAICLFSLGRDDEA